MSNTLPSDHRKGCQCQTCVQERNYDELTFTVTLWHCVHCGAEAALIQNIFHYDFCQLEKPKADAAQGGVQQTPEGSLEYKTVPIVEEKSK